MRRRRSGRLWSRYALALWFGALGAVAALRVIPRVTRDGALDATTAAWLGGAVLLVVTGAALAWRQSRRRG